MAWFAHIDFEVPDFGEFTGGPRAVGKGASGVALAQDSAAAFPDRPAEGGIGLRVAMEPGGGGRYLEHDLGGAKDVLHSRVMVNPTTAGGGAVTILRGLSEMDEETFRVVLNAVDRMVELLPATGEGISAALPAGLPWHCVEVKIDAVAGDAELWINGRSVAAAAGSFAAPATRRAWIGAPSKDVDAQGELHLDEWVLAGGYIGPVVVGPAGDFADDPARWLVIHNTAPGVAADSTAWAEHYRQARRIPFANLLGLDLPAAEEISESAFTSMRDAIEGYITANGLGGQIIGILCGHGVPGAYAASDGKAEAIAGQLHRIDGGSAEVTNPIAPVEDEEPLVRPTKANLAGNRLTARIDGPTLVDSRNLTERASALRQNGLGDGGEDAGGDAVIWLDPHGPPDESLFAQREGEMLDWTAGLDRQRLRLPLELPVEEDAEGEPRFSEIREDGFFWGWERLEPPEGFFAEPAGRRVFCMQLTFRAATALTLRDGSAPNWAIRSLQAGYAAAGGSSRAYSPSAVPRVGPFFEALRRGWTLGEAWFAASPVLRAGLMLVGDPLLTADMPRAGWNVYGPFESWGEVTFDRPIAALREAEREHRIGEAFHPADGERAVYVLRHVDAADREEAGVEHVRLRRSGDAWLSVPRSPVWPAGSGWSPVQAGEGWEIHACWADRFGSLGIVRIEWIEQVSGGAERLVKSEAVEEAAWCVRWNRIADAEPVRFKVRGVAADGGFAETGWSAWVTLRRDEPIALQTL